jgi:NAD(P)-dependent dehydrogenase (short-subunit alcohol dehydrogenase family)
MNDEPKMRDCLVLRGRVAVVMGATSGLGRVLALGLARHGADVIPSGRREEELAEVCREIVALGRRSLALPTDVTDRTAVESLRDAVVQEFGRVDILINAAGQTFRKPTVEVNEAEWANLIDTNLNGALRACQVFYEPLKASGRGRIVNIASLASFVAFYEVAAYSAAKTGLLSLTRSLACEWARDGICVNAIAPGVFPTELNSDLITSTERGRELLMRTPMGRFGYAEELVGAAVLFSSDAASFITGQCLAVDGGFLASGVNS